LIRKDVKYWLWLGCNNELNYRPIQLKNESLFVGTSVLICGSWFSKSWSVSHTQLNVSY